MASEQKKVIHVLATTEVKEGKRAEFLEAFSKLVPLVRAEDGCIEYTPAIDVLSGISI